jgi:hypothetical protein
MPYSPTEQRLALTHLSNRLTATKQTIDIRTRAAALLFKRKPKWDTTHIATFLKHFETGGTIEAASKKFNLSPDSIKTYLCKLRTKGRI